ncbi:MAG: quinone-dependent dihydroorotate dehydrogenase [bacterium]|nr:quinone-dependent dihydroorotate dehydrogenase [bacterium]
MNVLDSLYHRLAKPFLFRLDAEFAHHLVAAGVKHSATLPGAGLLMRRLLAYDSPRLANRVCGVRFPNPVGMAAGFDKTGELYPFLSRMGFGFVECGTFTAIAQPGNPRPRLFRYPAERALVNRMGFNNPGSTEAAEILARQKPLAPRGINIGKSKVTELEQATEDYLRSVERLEIFADYVAVNISSPNTPGLRKLQGKKYLGELLGALLDRLRTLGAGRVTPPTPLFVKVAPDLSEKELEAILETLVTVGCSGIIISNTTIDKSAVPGAETEGGLSGPAVRERSTKLVEFCHRTAGDRLAIIGVGGVNSGRDALDKILAGASLVQVYTGYVFEGPGLPGAINRYLDAVLERSGLSLSELIGRGRSELDALHATTG